jgi:hypothetical protein
MESYAELSFESVLRDFDSEDAVLFAMNGEERWIPRSVIKEIDVDGKQVEVKEWWAKEKGLV